MSATMHATADAQLASLAHVLQRHAYRFANEEVLHSALAVLLTEAGYTFTHEYRFDAKHRADFFLTDVGLIIEVKVDGTLSDALCQVSRYCKLESVRGVLLAAATAWGGTPIEEIPELHGRAFRMVRLQRRFL